MCSHEDRIWPGKHPSMLPKRWMFLLIYQPAWWHCWPQVNQRYLCDIWEESLLNDCFAWQGPSASFHTEWIPTVHPTLLNSMDRPSISRKKTRCAFPKMFPEITCISCHAAVSLLWLAWGAVITGNPCLNPKSPRDTVATQWFKTP